MHTGAQRRFAVFDIDGTVIRWQLYHAIVDELASLGHLSKNAHQTIQDARMTWKSRSHSTSFDEYEHTVVEAYHRALTDLDVTAYQQAVDSVFEQYKDQVYTYSRDLLRELKAKGYLLFIISGSQQEVVQKLGDYYGFDEAVGTQYEQRDGRFTGEYTAGFEHKDDILRQLIERHNATRKDSIAIGDSTSDITMLELAERPIAFNPTKGLFDHAKKRGWEVVIERKNVIYQLQAHHGQYLLAETD